MQNSHLVASGKANKMNDSIRICILASVVANIDLLHVIRESQEHRLEDLSQIFDFI